ncbi:MAG TPA: phosphoglycerate dehydrogenase [Bacteroidales bacterium]|jgi:D-3-phosphoglycerate dehydrogenase / 2-oxoglutarate reductase|nr:phosphoglycerate dehydrogenase [Bacteroidales bacterium]HBZ20027.1 phosphoglycerate dehydrogenase [Bacteroidales bacterium]
MPKQYSLEKDKIKVILLEGIHNSAADFFKANGYNNIESFPGALDEALLKEKIKSANIIGIRSRTLITQDLLSNAGKLLAIGCFSIGTNQVDGHAARLMGIPVFNAPFSNTRSVAELVIAEAILLMRNIPGKNAAAHRGKWLKSATNCFEVRDKNLGIVGYGHIGSQVSILAEALGMNVYYYDIVKKLSLGKAVACSSLEELLSVSHVVTLHVPETPLTMNLISEKELSLMRKGSCLVNASRGSVVNIQALTSALKSGHILGAALDVFPDEPASNGDPFISELQQFDNVILSPHVGGSTVEAQENIGTEVAEKLVKYSDTGATIGATNFVQISLQPNNNAQRFLHIHKNEPGILKEVNYVFTSKGINIAGEYLQTDPEIGYVIVDTESCLGSAILDELKAIEGTIRVRMLY